MMDMPQSRNVFEIFAEANRMRYMRLDGLLRHVWRQVHSGYNHREIMKNVPRALGAVNSQELWRALQEASFILRDYSLQREAERQEYRRHAAPFQQFQVQGNYVNVRWRPTLESVAAESADETESRILVIEYLLNALYKSIYNIKEGETETVVSFIDVFIKIDQVVNHGYPYPAQVIPQPAAPVVAYVNGRKVSDDAGQN